MAPRATFPFESSRTRSAFRAPGGGELEVLSTLSANNRQADEKAFRELMGHLKLTDARQQTVLMVQVENEVGVGGSTRDRSEEADRLFHSAVPGELLGDLKQHRDRLSPELSKAWSGGDGTWSQAFGDGAAASEIFMAWQYGRYIGQVAAAGKGAYGAADVCECAAPRPTKIVYRARAITLGSDHRKRGNQYLFPGR
jgi:hypothetical protein